MTNRWTDHAAWVQAVRFGLTSLRHYLERPEDGGVSWDNPFVELTYEVPWNLEAPFEEPQHEAFSRLTRRVEELREEGRVTYRLPQAVVDLLDRKTGTRTTEEGVEGPPEGVEARRRLVSELARPKSLGPFHVEASRAAVGPEEVPTVAEALEDGEEIEVHLEDLEEVAPTDTMPLRFTATAEAGEELEGEVVALVYPLVRDVAKRSAWFTLGIGLAFTKGDPRRFSAEDLEELWAFLTAAPEDVEAPTPAPLASPPQWRVLQDSKVRLDALASRAVGFFGDAKLWRKWDRVRDWDTLAHEEVQRLLAEYGEAAFARDGAKGPLLKRHFLPGGEKVVKLSKRAERALEVAAGPRGYRRVLLDPLKTPREYLVKRVAAGRGYITLCFTWHGQARILSEEAMEREARAIREQIEREKQQLFQPSEQEKARRDQALSLLGSMRDASKLAPTLLSLFYQQRENPVLFPVWQGYRLLDCEQDPNRFARVNAALETLRRLEYRYEANHLGEDVDGEARGSFVSDIRTGPGRGAGDHKDLDFEVRLSEWAIGCLRIFQLPEGEAKDPARILYNWNGKVPKAKLKRVEYLQGFSALAPYFDQVDGFTEAQKRLRVWIEDQLTLRRDAAAKGRERERVKASDPTADQPRTFTSAFCPLLEEGKRYHAPLGHFSRNAETGRTLKGRSQDPTATGGPRSGGLLEVLGYVLPPGRAAQARGEVVADALKDLRAVVEEAYGGRVLGRQKGAWITLRNAEDIRTEELVGEVAWFLFLPEDWHQRRVQRFEALEQRRFREGKTSSPIRITSSAAPPPKVEEVVVKHGLEAMELRVRLHAARKRRGLTTAATGKVFGVSAMVISNWERGKEWGGSPIPDYWAPLLLRWVETGEGPKEAEKEGLLARRRGGGRKPSRSGSEGGS